MEIKTRAKKPASTKVETGYLLLVRKDQKEKMALLKKKGFSTQELLRNYLDELFAQHIEEPKHA